MTTLVTGATGFLGSAVTRKLIEAGETVRVTTRPGSDRRNLQGLDVEIVTADLDDPLSLKRALNGCRMLYHVAADYRLWVPDPPAIYRTNVEGTRALMEAALALELERIVYTSSIATLGLNADGSPANEHTPVGLEQMIGHYKRSKYLAEQVVQELVSERSLPAVIVNPSAPVGPRDVKPTPTGKLVLDAAAGKMPAYVNTGLNIVHVDDVAAGHLLAAQRGEPGERYILGGANMSLRDILTAVAALCGRAPPRLRLPHGLALSVAHVAEFWARLSGGEPLVTVDGARLARKPMYFTSERAIAELGYSARPAGDALSDSVAWFMDAGYLDRR